MIAITNNPNQLKRINHASSGFTLVELIVVIVILGILSATALPKLINLKDKAIIAKLQGMQSAVQSASQLVYAKLTWMAKRLARSGYGTKR